jgi:PadR family transcriptional regulator PadR
VDIQNWQIQLRKGLLEIAILNLLARGRSHGYELVQRLKRCRGLTIREGNVYPILMRLQIDNLVDCRTEPSSDGPPRKYFDITNAGRTALAQMNEHWDELIVGIRDIRQGEQV